MIRFLLGVIAAVAFGFATPASAQLSEATQFLKAVKDRDAEKALSLISSPGSVVINSKDGDTGEGALHLLVRERDMTWLGYLLNKGARPDIQDRGGMTPLALSAQIGWVEGAERLLRGRAKVDLGNKDGETPLIFAVHNRDIPMIKLLLSKGANPQQSDTVSGQSALDYARRDPRAALIVKMLESPPASAAKVQGPSL